MVRLVPLALSCVALSTIQNHLNNLFNRNHKPFTIGSFQSCSIGYPMAFLLNGNASDRVSEAVTEDFADGYITDQAAERDYGWKKT